MAERHDTDVLFKALADPSRRKLLDLLHAHDGRTLNELCEHLDMTRQGVTPRKAALPQSSTATGDLRALDCQVRKAAPQGTLGSETTTGENQWLDRPLST
jgi:DNA-binding transcriptional ArsR family regulator